MKKAKKTGKGKIALQLRPAATAAAAAAGFAAGAAGGYILFWIPAAAVICGLAGAAAAPFITAAELGRRREKLMLLQFRDFLGSLCNSFSAGRNLTGALEDSYRELSFTYGPGASFVREVRRINDGLGNGFTAEELLNECAGRCGGDAVESFAETFGICIRTGGDMKKAAADCRDVLCAKIDTEMEIRVCVASNRTELNILSAMPFAVALMLRLMGGGAVCADTPLNTAVRAGALALFAAAYVTGAKITDIKV